MCGSLPVHPASIQVGVHQLDWTVSFPDGVVRTNVSVEKASLSQITVTVGELYTKEVPVECQVIGEVAEGYFTGDVVLDPDGRHAARSNGTIC